MRVIVRLDRTIQTKIDRIQHNRAGRAVMIFFGLTCRNGMWY